MQKEKETGRKEMIKKIAVIFLVTMLVLTFFSNTIMNYSLPEIATESVTSGKVANKVRGEGTVETNSDYEVTVSGNRVIKEVKIETGDEVKKDQVLFTFEEGEDSELETAQETLAEMELEYAKSLLKSLPDYSSDNNDIETAQKELDDAVTAQNQAAENGKQLTTAQKAATQAEKDVASQQKKVDELQKKVDAYGEVGDYESAQAQVTTTSRELETLRIALSDLKEDLAAAQADGDTDRITELNRAIRDKELEISNCETDLNSQKAVAEAIKSTSSTYTKLKSDLEKANTKLTELQSTLAAKNAEVEALSQVPSVEEAKQTVEEKRKALELLVQSLQSKKEEDSLSQKAEDMDMQAAKEKIEKQKKLVEKLKNSSDVKEIKAKEDGIVSEVSFKEGDSVTPETPLAKIQLSESGYIVSVTVTKEQSKLVKVGNEASIENIWDEDLTAEVKSIKADPENPNRNAIIVFEVKGDVEPGETLSLAAGEKSQRYDTIVPNNAIKEDSNGKFVLLVSVKGTPLGNRYKIKRVNVEVMASDESMSGVTGDLYEYDNVVTNSSKPLEEGMQVRLAE